MGGDSLSGRDCVLGMLMRQGAFFLSPPSYLVPQSEPTSSLVDVWAICTQHARRVSEHEAL